MTEHNAELRGQAPAPTNSQAEFDVLKAFYDLTVKERDLARYQADNRQATITTLREENEKLKTLIVDFDNWASHDDQCDGYYDPSGRYVNDDALCTCGLTEIHTRARAVTTNVVPPAEAATEPTTSLEVERYEIKGPTIILDTRPRCKEWHPTHRWVSCDMEKGHEGNHEAHYGNSRGSTEWA